MSGELNKLPEPFGYVSDWFGSPDGLMRFSRTTFPELHNLTHSVCSVFSVPQVLDVQQQAYAAGKAARIAELEAERDQLRAEVERLRGDSVPLGAIRALAVEAIRDVTGCPDIANGDKCITDTIEHIAQHATYRSIEAAKEAK